MTETAPDEAGELRGERAIELRVPARLENLTVLRTLVGAVGALADLDLDTVADLRLAIDEVCTQLITSAEANATLTVVVDPGDDGIVVRAFVPGRIDDVLTPGSFSWYVLTSLVDDVRILRDGERGGVGFALTTHRAGAPR